MVSVSFPLGNHHHLEIWPSASQQGVSTPGERAKLSLSCFPSTFFLVIPSFSSPNFFHSEVRRGREQTRQRVSPWSLISSTEVALLRCLLVRGQICYLEKHIRSGHHYRKGKLLEMSKAVVKMIKRVQEQGPWIKEVKAGWEG